MENRNGSFNGNEEKSKAKIVWKHIGLIVLALAMAVVTVVVLNLNR